MDDEARPGEEIFGRTHTNAMGEQRRDALFGDDPALSEGSKEPDFRRE